MSDVKHACNDAIAMHAKWKRWVTKALADGESIDALAVSRCDACELGSWLASDGFLLLEVGDWTPLQAAHERLHAIVGEIASEYTKGADVEAALGAYGSLNQASASLIALLMAVRDAE